MIEQNWNNASWLGSQRAIIRRSHKFTIRQRLQALKDLYKTGQKLASIKTRKQHR